MSCFLVAGYLMPPRNFCTLTKSASLIACSFLVCPSSTCALGQARASGKNISLPPDRARKPPLGVQEGGRVQAMGGGVAQVSRQSGVTEVTPGSQHGHANGTRKES